MATTIRDNLERAGWYGGGVKTHALPPPLEARERAALRLVAADEREQRRRRDARLRAYDALRAVAGPSLAAEVGPEEAALALALWFADEPPGPFTEGVLLWWAWARFEGHAPVGLVLRFGRDGWRRAETGSAPVYDPHTQRRRPALWAVGLDTPEGVSAVRHAATLGHALAEAARVWAERPAPF